MYVAHDSALVTWRLYRKSSILTSPGSGEQAQARQLEAVPSRYDATQQQEAYANEEQTAGRGTPVHPGSVSRTANRPLLNDAMAVKASHDDSMLRPLLGNARALSSSTASASRSLEISSDQLSASFEPSTSPSATSSGNDELSSFLIRSQEKRKRFSSSLQQLMRTTPNADEQSRDVRERAWFEESVETESEIAQHESTCRAHLIKRLAIG